MIQKPAVFVTSTGRTGTAFFGGLFGRVVRECDSFHEPDCVAGDPLQDFVDASQLFGLRQVVLEKLRPMGNMRGLTVGRTAGKLQNEPAVRGVERLREAFVRGLPGQLYVESNHQLVGLIDILPQVFRRCRIVYLVRDAREWVRSCWGHAGGFYRARDLVRLLSGGRLRAPMCSDDPWAARWTDMSRFEKNCWLWAKKNRYALDCLRGTDEARMWRFEDVFLGNRRYEVLEKLVQFATCFPGGPRFEYTSLDGVLERPVNASGPGALPRWREWSEGRVRAFRLICGELMDELGYGREPEWQWMCERAGAS